MRWVVLAAAAVFFAGIAGALVAAYRHPTQRTPPLPTPMTKTVAK